MVKARKKRWKIWTKKVKKRFFKKPKKVKNRWKNCKKVPKRWTFSFKNIHFLDFFGVPTIYYAYAPILRAYPKLWKVLCISTVVSFFRVSFFMYFLKMALFWISRQNFLFRNVSEKKEKSFFNKIGQNWCFSVEKMAQKCDFFPRKGQKGVFPLKS